MAWHQDFEGIPLEGKHINYSFCFCVDNEDSHVYETICDKESTAKRRYGRFIKKYGDKVEIISFWKYVWENGEMNMRKYHVLVLQLQSSRKVADLFHEALSTWSPSLKFGPEVCSRLLEFVALMLPVVLQYHESCQSCSLFLDVPMSYQKLS